MSEMETVEAPWPQTVCLINGWPAVNGTCPQHKGDACLAEFPGYLDYLKAGRDAAAQVATTAFRDAMTEQTTTRGPSLAELAHVEVEDRANFRIQDDIADVLTRWTVPPAHRPTCPLDQKPCTHWSCLVDVCVDAKKDRADA